SAYMERMVMRTDGFVSAPADFQGGEFTTRPLIFQGSNLVLNFATSAAGSIKLEVQDGRGNPLPGLSLADAQPLFGDRIEAIVKLESKPRDQRHSLSGLPVRLRFVMKDADLYSIQFRD